MFTKVTIIAFDLDDTLWPCMPVIQKAEETLYAWLSQHYPRITASYDPEQMVALRKRFTAQNPRFSVDLSLMRFEFLKQLARESQYDADEVAKNGFDVFYHARQQVGFYDDVFPVLERLTAKYRLGAITNGNASVEKVGLGHLIEHSVSAIDLQVAKPDPRIYHSLADCFNAPPEQVLYIGDHPEYDVIGPQDAGLQAIWINREDQPWPQALAPPKHQISDLYELETLLASY
ncbi:MAG: HAD superfamily hydrolase (TIGR01549 family) [Gammaproteobacteria bacterium]